ncbi:hypothetical protein [Nocardia farcinica]|uniref:hypothetical protein n=1 Tax=Nocardia farcinica TaxID=37329 RepID=UPI0024565AD5|nr:hypothetical protein [Nocardia farcinica]
MGNNYESIADIRADAEANEGLITVSLLDLREALGYKKLGPRVLATIAQELEGHGLGYFPKSLLDDNDTPRSHEEVRVFVKNTQLGIIIDSVLSPHEVGDDRLREVGRDKNAEMIAEIRRLLE